MKAELMAQLKDKCGRRSMVIKRTWIVNGHPVEIDAVVEFLRGVAASISTHCAGQPTVVLFSSPYVFSRNPEDFVADVEVLDRPTFGARITQHLDEGRTCVYASVPSAAPEG